MYRIKIAYMGLILSVVSSIHWEARTISPVGEGGLLHLPGWPRWIFLKQITLKFYKNRFQKNSFNTINLNQRCLKHHVVCTVEGTLVYSDRDPARLCILGVPRQPSTALASQWISRLLCIVKIVCHYWGDIIWRHSLKNVPEKMLLEWFQSWDPQMNGLFLLSFKATLLDI